MFKTLFLLLSSEPFAYRVGSDRRQLHPTKNNFLLLDIPFYISFTRDGPKPLPPILISRPQSVRSCYNKWKDLLLPYFTSLCALCHLLWHLGSFFWRKDNHSRPFTFWKIILVNAKFIQTWIEGQLLERRMHDTNLQYFCQCFVFNSSSKLLQ